MIIWCVFFVNVIFIDFLLCWLEHFFRELKWLQLELSCALDVVTGLDLEVYRLF